MSVYYKEHAETLIGDQIPLFQITPGVEVLSLNHQGKLMTSYVAVVDSIKPTEWCRELKTKSHTIRVTCDQNILVDQHIALQVDEIPLGTHIMTYKGRKITYEPLLEVIKYPPVQTVKQKHYKTIYVPSFENFVCNGFFIFNRCN